MKVFVKKSDLSDALAFANKQTGRKNLPILSNLALRAKFIDGEKESIESESLNSNENESDELRDGYLEISATNLEVGVNISIGASVIKSGAITVNSGLLTELITTLPNNDEVLFELEEETNINNYSNANRLRLKVRSGLCTSNFKGIPEREFPIVKKNFDGGSEILIDSKTLRESLSQVSFACSSQEARPVLTGVQFIFSDDYLTLEATDGYRLSQKKIDYRQNGIETKFILPKNTCEQLSVMLSKFEGNLKIILPPDDVDNYKNQVIFAIGNMNITSQLVNGDFPDVSKIIPTDYQYNLRLSSRQLVQIFRNSASFSKTSENYTKLTITPPSSREHKGGNLLIESNTDQQIGSIRVSLNCEMDCIDNSPFSIAFNVRYLLEGISSLSKFDIETIDIKFIDKATPLLLTAKGRDDYVHIIMPMILKT